MAFSTAAGYGNLPNGNFSPVIYSKQVQLAFRKSTVVGDITNSDYFGEISGQGDTVRIIKEPEISVSAYARGTQVTAQDLEDEDFQLVVDKANYYAFKMDDIEEAHSHVNFESMASDRAGYRLKDQFDQEVLGYLTGFKQATLSANAGTARVAADKSGTDPIAGAAANGLLASMLIARDSFVSGGAATDSIATHPDGSTGEATPLEVLNRMARLLDQQNVDRDGRWVVVDPVFAEQLNDENSKLLIQLRIYPYFQLGMIALFLMISYFAFSYSRRSEQNKVWAGMSKETAHQLGTPISSLIGWVDYLKEGGYNVPPKIIGEINHDLERLNLITERFSKIGSEPSLSIHSLYEVLNESISYINL